MAGATDPTITALRGIMTRADVALAAQGRLKPSMMVSRIDVTGLQKTGIIPATSLDYSTTTTQGHEQEEEMFPRNAVLVASCSPIVISMFKQCSHLIVDGSVVFTADGIEIQHFHNTPGAYIIGHIDKVDLDNYWVKDGQPVKIFTQFSSFLDKVKANSPGEMRYDVNGAFMFIKNKLVTQHELDQPTKGPVDLSGLPKKEEIILELAIPSNEIAPFFPKPQRGAGWKNLDLEITDTTLVLLAHIRSGNTSKIFHSSVATKGVENYQFTKFTTGKKRKLRFDINGIHDVNKLITGKKVLEFTIYESGYACLKSTYGQKSDLQIYLPLIEITEELPISTAVEPSTAWEEGDGDSALHEFA